MIEFLTLVAATVSPVIEFRGVPLGITLLDFKSRPSLDGSIGSLCSDTSHGSWVDTNRNRQKAGEVVCAYARFDAWGDFTGNMIEDWELPIPLSPSINVTARFFFYNSRLYQIKVEGPGSSFDTISEALVSKYGKPKVERIYMGALASSWKINSVKINVCCGNYSQYNPVGISYIDVEVASQLDVAEKKVEAEEKIANEPVL